MSEVKHVDPMVTVESAIAVYQDAQAKIDELTAVKDAAKALIMSVMEETGVTSYATAAGKASITGPAISVSYDAKAIDILLHDDADLAMRLSPYRKETMRAGSMRITAKK